MPRAWPSLSVATGVLVDEGRLDRRLVRARTPRPPARKPVVDRRPAARRAPPCRLVATEPQATKIRRLPSTSIRPQPVRRSPGSMPRMRIGRPMRAPLIAPPAASAKRPHGGSPFSPIALRPAAARQAAGPTVIDLPDSATFAAALAEPPHLRRDGGRGAGRAGARLLRLRRRDDLHAAGRRDLRPAHRRGHHPAGRFRHRPRRSPSPRCAAAPGARWCRSRSPWRSACRSAPGADRARSDRAALVHRRRRAEPAAGAGVGLALSRHAAPADHPRRRPVLRRERRRGADRGPAGDPLLAQRRQHAPRPCAPI